MRDILVALSLANLLFLRGWEKFQYGGFLNDLKPDGPSVAILVVATALALWIAWQVAKKDHRLAITAQIIFLLLLLIPVNALRLYFDQAFTELYGPKYKWIFWAIVALLVLPVIIALFKRRFSFTFLVSYGTVLVLALAPFVLFTVGGVLWNSFRAYRAATSRPQPAPAVTSRAKQRVVLIVFDELDYGVAFRLRPATLKLPEFDRLRSESLWSAKSFPPGGQTAQSLPALLNGVKIAHQAPLGGARMAIFKEGSSQPEIWSRDMTIFAETSGAGFRTAVAGVYFPYCAILGNTVDDCRDFRTFRQRSSLMTRLKSAGESALDAVPFLYRMWLRRAQRRDEIHQCQYTIQQAGELAADQSFNFVFIHLPIPHPPPIYDRRSGQFADAGEHSYVDNLALADRALGELRRAMEQTGAWENTSVIVTSDHWWRTWVWRAAPFWSAESAAIAAHYDPDHNVPFLVKLAGRHEGAVYQREFNTVVTRKLIMTMLREGIKTNSDLGRWLDQNAIGPPEPLIGEQRGSW